jgi:hypothetical protein
MVVRSVIHQIYQFSVRHPKNHLEKRQAPSPSVLASASRDSLTRLLSIVYTPLLLLKTLDPRSTKLPPGFSAWLSPRHQTKWVQMLSLLLPVDFLQTLRGWTSVLLPCGFNLMACVAHLKPIVHRHLPISLHLRKVFFSLKICCPLQCNYVMPLANLFTRVMKAKLL